MTAVELKHLLSILTAALTALGAILYSMGPQHAWLAAMLWMLAILSLVVTDFLRVLRLPRRIGTLLIWVVLVVFTLQFLWTWQGGLFAGHSFEWLLQTVANILIFLQCVLLFQEKDAPAYGGLIVMSLLLVVVAARYSRDAAFGSLLVVYSIVGIFALSLLALYGQRQRAQHALPDGKRREKRDKHNGSHRAEREAYAGPGRWPLAGVEIEFASSPSGGERAGIVPEFFARLSLIVAGGLLLATIIFSIAPRPRIPSWRGGDTQKAVAVVGFNDRIELGVLGGDMIESREEVMRVKLLDAATRQPYRLSSNEIYLRGTAVTWYSHNQWRRLEPSAYRDDGAAAPQLDGESIWGGGPPSSENDAALRIGAPVIQEMTVEPNLARTDLFFIWPLIDQVDRRYLNYEPDGERLYRKVGFSGEIPPGDFTYEVVTSGLANGCQAPLVPARRLVRPSPRLLQMPGDGASLPRLTALAAKWRRESGLKPGQHYEIAHYFQRQFSSSGQFHYSLQPVERNGDPIEDFVSNNPRGHCEYFATALAMMLRSQGIPSRVILGYRCDEWDPRGQCFQVRQLHAHAWVEAFLDPQQIPESLRRAAPTAGPTAAGCGWTARPATTSAARPQIEPRSAHGGRGCTPCNTIGNATSPTWTTKSSRSQSISRCGARSASSPAACSVSVPGGSSSTMPAPPWPICSVAVSWAR